eukprot:sb/3476255/
MAHVKDHNIPNSIPSNPGIDMVDIINSLNEERMVVFVSQDEASSKLSMEARLAIEKLGSTLIHDLGWRDSWAFIGQVRHSEGLMVRLDSHREGHEKHFLVFFLYSPRGGCSSIPVIEM